MHSNRKPCFTSGAFQPLEQPPHRTHVPFALPVFCSRLLRCLHAAFSIQRCFYQRLFLICLQSPM